MTEGGVFWVGSITVSGTAPVHAWLLLLPIVGGSPVVVLFLALAFIITISSLRIENTTTKEHVEDFFRVNVLFKL